MVFYLSSTFSQLACLYGRELAPVRILQNAAIQFYLDLGSSAALALLVAKIVAYMEWDSKSVWMTIVFD